MTPTLRTPGKIAWSIEYSTQAGEPYHSDLVDSWMLWHGFLLFRDELVKVDLVGTPTIANGAAWRWRIVPAEHEGNA
jgi:hypothetical protein